MYTIKGTVIHGKNKGHELGFPTANVSIEQVYETGVYAGSVVIGSKSYPAAIFLGKEPVAEAYIFDYVADLYGREIEIKVGKKIREPRKFENDKDLKAQIAMDIEEIKSMCN